MIVAAYLVETGLLLIAAPWTTFWRYNFFADHSPWIRQVMSTRSGQMAVVLTGLITALGGLKDAYRVLLERTTLRTATAEKTPPAA